MGAMQPGVLAGSKGVVSLPGLRATTFNPTLGYITSLPHYRQARFHLRSVGLAVTSGQSVLQ